MPVTAPRLCLLTLWSSVLAAQEPTVVPTETCRGYFFVPITLGDDPDATDRTLWFLHDTGASTTYVDPDSLERVSGQRVPSGRTARFDKARSGRVTYGSLRARVRDLDHLGTMLGREIDGILGFGVFDQFLLTLDYDKSEMRLERGELPPPDNETVFSASGRDERPWLDVRVGRYQRRMLIDSGAALVSLVVNDLADYQTIEPPRAVGGSVRFDHVERRSGARLDGDAMLGSHRLPSPTLYETPGTELIGGEVLRHFVWTFDQKNERVRIERIDADAPIAFAPIVTHGMLVVPEDGALRVRSVVEGGPAEAAGVLEDDLITHIDGLPVGERGCEPSKTESLALTLVRDRASLEVPMPLFPLVQ